MNCVDRPIDISNYNRSNYFNAENCIRRGIIFGFVVASLCVSKIATAAWVDGFDTYTAGVPMSNPGNGGPPWYAFDTSDAFAGIQPVTDQSLSAPNSIQGSGTGRGAMFRLADSGDDTLLGSFRFGTPGSPGSSLELAMADGNTVDGTLANLHGTTAYIGLRLDTRPGNPLDTLDFVAIDANGTQRSRWNLDGAGLVQDTWYDVRIRLNGNTADYAYKPSASATWIENNNQAVTPGFTFSNVAITTNNGTGSDLWVDNVATSVAPPPAVVLNFDSTSGLAVDGGNNVNSWTATTGQLATPQGGAAASPNQNGFTFASGQPGIKFDGVNDILEFSDAALPAGNNPFTMAVVLNIPAYAVGEPPFRPSWFSWGNDGATAANVPNQMAAMGVNRVPGTGGDGATRTLMFRTDGSDVNSGLRVEQATNYIALISQDALGNTTIELKSATSLLSFSGLAGSNPPITLERGRIGNMVDSINNDFAEGLFNGYIGRIMVFDDQLNPAECAALLAQLEPYLTEIVPEPSSFALAGLGMIGLAAVRRRRSR